MLRPRLAASTYLLPVGLAVPLDVLAVDARGYAVAAPETRLWALAQDAPSVVDLDVSVDPPVLTALAEGHAVVTLHAGTLAARLAIDTTPAATIVSLAVSEPRRKT